MLIRRGTDADDAAIRVVHDAAFAKPDAPGAETVEAKLVGELRADGDLLPALSLVAEIDGRIAGHVCCSHARIGSTPGPVGLGPLGVLPELQSTGVGSALMHAVIAAADALDLPAIVLLGSPRLLLPVRLRARRGIRHHTVHSGLGAVLPGAPADDLLEGPHRHVPLRTGVRSSLGAVR